MSLLESGIRWLADSGAAGERLSVTYRRGDTCLNITALPAGAFSSADSEIGIIETNSLDWIIKHDALAQLEPNWPERGDKLTIVQNDVSRDFEVGAAPESDEPPWRWQDGYHEQMRVHTTRIRVIT